MGPFETAQAAHAAAVEAIPPAAGWSILGEDQNRALLKQACETAGVELGAWDIRVLGWIADYEDSVSGAIAGIILRAHEAGRGGPQPAPRSRPSLRATEPEGEQANG